MYALRERCGKVILAATLIALLGACGGRGATSTPASTATLSSARQATTAPTSLAAVTPTAQVITTEPADQAEATSTPAQAIPEATKTPTETVALEPTNASAPTVAATATAAPATSTAPTDAQTPTTAAGSPEPGVSEGREVIVDAQRAFLKAEQYRGVVTSEDLKSGKQVSKTIIEFVAPDRYRILQTPPGAPRSETIAIGKKTYVRSNNGEWQEADVDFGEFIARFRDPKVIEELSKSITNVESGGKATVNGTSTKVYSYRSTFGDIKSESKIWIGAEDGLPYKSVSEGEFQGVRSRTTTVYEYRDDIKIEAPI